MGYTWFSAAFDSTDVPHRLGLLAAMLAVTAVAAGVPGALGEGSSTTLVVAYTLLQAVLVALFVRAGLRAPEARPLTARYATGNAVGAGLWLASLALTETARPWMWAAAMVVLLTTPVFAVRALAEQAYDPAHIPERYGLFTLIVLGESIVVVTAGLETGGGATPILAAVCGFAIAACVWWVYFDRVKAIPGRERLLASFLWGYAHLLIFAGIAAAAVGVAFAVEAAAGGEALAAADRGALAGGLAAYLTGIALVHAASRGLDGTVAVRLLGAAALVAAGVVDTALSPLPFVALALVVLVCCAVAEPAARRPPPPMR